jgi:Mn2+/Fe2+ NRAMP family transporter
VLLLSFGRFEDAVDPVDALRRTLWLVLAGVFATVAFIASKVWKQVARLLAPASPPAAPSAWTDSARSPS